MVAVAVPAVRTRPPGIEPCIRLAKISVLVCLIYVNNNECFCICCYRRQWMPRWRGQRWERELRRRRGGSTPERGRQSPVWDFASYFVFVFFVHHNFVFVFLNIFCIFSYFIEWFIGFCIIFSILYQILDFVSYFVFCIIFCILYEILYLYFVFCSFHNHPKIWNYYSKVQKLLWNHNAYLFFLKFTWYTSKV